jgi:hypothetical protein
MYTKTVPMILFDRDGKIFHSCDAEVVNETPDTVTIKCPGYHTYHLLTYSKKDGQQIDGKFPLLPHYVMMAAKTPLRDSFVHLP